MKKTMLLGLLAVFLLAACNQPVATTGIESQMDGKTVSTYVPAWDPKVAYSVGDQATVSWKGYVYDFSGTFAHTGIEPGTPESMQIWLPAGPYTYTTESPVVTLMTEEWFLEIDSSSGADITAVKVRIAGTVFGQDRFTITTVGFGVNDEYAISVDTMGNFDQTIMYRGIVGIPTTSITESTTLSGINGAGVNEIVLNSPPLSVAQATLVPTPTPTLTPCPCATYTPTVPPTPTPTVNIPAEWDSAKAYSSGDLVSWKTAVWKAKWWTQGEEPGANEWGPWEWQYDLVVQITPTPTLEITPTTTPTSTPTIEPTPTYTTCPCGDPWDPAAVYQAGDLVFCPDGRVFKAKWWTTGGDNPCEGTSQWGPWEQVG